MTGHLFQALFVFGNCPLKETGFERKNKVNILRVFDNNLSKYLISCMRWHFWVIYQKRKGSGINFWCTFSAWIVRKNALYLILYQWTKFQYHNFLSILRYQTKYVIKFLLRQLMTSYTLRFILDQALKQRLTEKNRGRWKYKNLNISRRKWAF